MAGGGEASDLMLVLLALSLITIWGNMINHYADWEADEINHKRLYLHRSLTRADLLRYQWIPLLMFVVMVLVGLRHHPQVAVALGGGLIFAFHYSLGAKIKDKLWLSYLYLVVAYGVYPLLIGFLIGSNQVLVTSSLAGLLILSFILFLDLAIAPSKDIEDAEGDRITGKRTLPNVFGEIFTLKFQTIIFLLATALGISLIWINPTFWLSAPVILLSAQAMKRLKPGLRPLAQPIIEIAGRKAHVLPLDALETDQNLKRTSPLMDFEPVFLANYRDELGKLFEFKRTIQPVGADTDIQYIELYAIRRKTRL